MQPRIGDRVSWFDGNQQQWGIVHNFVRNGRNELLVYLENKQRPILMDQIDQWTNVEKPIPVPVEVPKSQYFIPPLD